MEALISKKLATDLFLNKSVMHRGPHSMVSPRSLTQLYGHGLLILSKAGLASSNAAPSILPKTGLGIAHSAHPPVTPLVNL